MPEKYFVTQMKKIPLSEDDFVYIVDSVIAGDIDEKTKVLTSTSGEHYKRIDDFTDLNKPANYYSNIVEVDKITSIFGNKYDFSDAVKEYERYCKQIIYYVSKAGQDGYMMLPIDKRPYLKAMERVQENPKAFENGPRTLPPDDQPMKDEYEDPFIESLKELVSRVVAGKYSPDELIDIKCRLNEQKEEIEAAIDSVELHQDALDEELDAASRGIKTPPKPTPLGQGDVLENININDIFDKVTKVLIAQDKPARRVIVELSRLDRMRKKGYGILLTGDSGVGKTLLMSLLARHINRPFLAIDSTQLTAQGFVGNSIEQNLWQLYEDCGHDLKKAERAIIYFDEIDKKGSANKNDISGQAVLNMLLKFLDGTTYTACKSQQHQTPETTVKINTSNMIVVSGGAFLDVYKKEEKRPMGFATESKEEVPTKDIKPTIKDFIDKSLMTKEFMGRHPVIIHLNSLDIDGIRRVLLESDDSALKIQEEVFASAGVKLTTKDGYIVSVAKKALDEDLGARGLNTYITETTWQAFDEVTSNPGVYEEVILTEETVENGEKYQLVKRKTKK